MARIRLGRRSARATSSTIVLLGVGAAVGVALGAIFADRLRGRPRRAGTGEPWLHGAHGVYDEDDDAPPVRPRKPRRSVPEPDDATEPVRLPSVERRVLEAFRNDPVLRERAIDIGEDAPGVIALTGWVRDDDEVAHARTIAGGVPGVVEVDNALAVRRPRRPWTLRGTTPDGAVRG
ncbi:MAG: BON domain-containing protein [Gemmatimonadaceae bacterium]|nr:BON domain-containing protein [Gemmatimonadaceae bacterium]